MVTRGGPESGRKGEQVTPGLMGEGELDARSREVDEEEKGESGQEKESSLYGGTEASVDRLRMELLEDQNLIKNHSLTQSHRSLDSMKSGILKNTDSKMMKKMLKKGSKKKQQTETFWQALGRMFTFDCGASGN